jgi:hypothetical protein
MTPHFPSSHTKDETTLGGVRSLWLVGLKKFPRLKSIPLKKHSNMVKINQAAKPALPEGWQCRTSKRRKGQTRGRVDKLYIAPNGTQYRSLRAVNEYLSGLAEQPKTAPVVPVAPAVASPEAAPVVVPENIAIEDNDGNDVIVIDSSSDEDDYDEDLHDKIKRYDEERIVDKIKRMQDVAENEQLEEKRAVHEIFIAELQMLLEKTNHEHNTANGQDHRQRLRVFLKERIVFWEQSLAKLSQNEVTWNHIAHQNHIHELRSRELQIRIDAFLASDDESGEDSGNEA